MDVFFHAFSHMWAILVEWVFPMFYLVSPYSLALNADDPKPKFILKAIPLFLLFIIIEALIGHFVVSKKDSKRYPKNSLMDSLSSMSCGIVEESFQLILDVLGVQVNVFLYTIVYERFRLITYDANDYPVLTFVSLMLCTDLGYYTLHRFNHEWHFLWTGHRVHHSGEIYNLSTALRQSIPQRLTSPFFYLPLALVFNPKAFSAHSQLNVIYQFWVHTELVGWMGPVEYVLSTPSAHRMHHRPPGNCNYAGVFIIWDRIFGSYECENITGYKDYYGLAEPETTFDPCRLHIGHWKRMALIPGPWLKRLTLKRVTGNTWTFRPHAMFDPIPPPSKPDEGEVRAKFQGFSMPWHLKMLCSAIFASCLAKFVLLALNHKTMSPHGAIIEAVAVIVALCSMCHFASHGSKSACILAVVSAIIAQIGM